MNVQGKLLVCAAGIAVVMLTVCSVRADDLSPPDYRGQPTTVFAHWDFRGTSNPLIDFHFGPDPDGPSGPITPNTGVEPGIQVFTPDPEHPYTTFRFTIPNWIDELEYKCMRIQLTYTQFIQTPGVFEHAGIANVRAFDNGAEIPPIPDNIHQKFVTDPETISQDANSITSYYYQDWMIIPNPDYEMFDINLPNDPTGGDVVLDQIVVDTISLPEPASVALLGAGLLLVMRRRRGA